MSGERQKPELEVGQVWLAASGRTFTLLGQLRPHFWEWRCDGHVGASYGWTIREKCELQGSAPRAAAGVVGQEGEKR